jgi:hypothetical protein
VSRESKVLTGVGAVILLGLIVTVAVSRTTGLFLILLGIGAAILSLRLTRGDTSDPFAEARSAADETQVGNLTPSQPLAPWNPNGGLNAWTPPVSYTSLPDAAPAPPAIPPTLPTVEPAPEPVAETSNWTDSWNNDDNWAGTATWDPAPSSTETNPLDELKGFDTLDPIAEVERIEARTAEDYALEPPPAPEPVEQTYETFSFGNANRGFESPVNEDVSGADDIMAASQATELHLADGEQTELQKLLAKVQIRLSAYE